MAPLLIGRYPDFAQNFAAEMPTACLPVAAHDAPTGAHHRDAQTIEYRLEVAVTAIDPPAWFAYPLDGANHLFALVAVFQENPQDRLGVFFAREELLATGLLVQANPSHLVIENVALFFEHLGDANFFARGGHIYIRGLDAQGIADAGQHVGNRVGHHLGSS
jgi:hypothetical protein